MAAGAISAGIGALGSLFGGLQTRSAINDAVDALLQSYSQAGETGRVATGQANQEIKDNAFHWGDMVQAAGQDAGNWATDAAKTGQAGVTGAVEGAQAGLQPYQTAGSTALDSLTRMLTKPATFQFQADPGYQFRLSEGLKTINRQAAAHGAAGGGATAKAAAQFSSGLASTEYDNAWNRWNTGRQQQLNGLSTVAGMGERAGEVSGQFGMTGAQYNAGLGEQAAQYAGNQWSNATQWAGGSAENAINRTTTNDLDYANFLANLQLQGGQTRATGDMMRAGVWNNVIGAATGGASGINWGKLFGGSGIKPGGIDYGGGAVSYG